MITRLDTLADGRVLYRLQTELAPQLGAGHFIAVNNQPCPVFRHDVRANTIDFVAAADLTCVDPFINIIGQVLSLPAEFSDHAFSGPEFSQLKFSGPECSRLIMLCDGDGLFRALHLLHTLNAQQRQRCVVLAHNSTRWPFRPAPSRFLTPQLPAHVTAAIPLLEDWKVLSRLAHPGCLPGCHDGTLEELLRGLYRDGDSVLQLPVC